MGALAKRLRVAALDHTGGAEEQTAWTEVDKPLTAQGGRAAPRRQFPPLPDGSRIAVLGDVPERRIVLPRAGFTPSYFICVVFPLFPPWFTGKLSNLHISGPFIAIAGLFALFAVIACVTNKEVAEDGDSIAFVKRLFGASLSTRKIAKRDIVEIKLKPVPVQRGRRSEEIQVRASSALLNLTLPRLSHEEIAWLTQAVQTMAAAV
jgi:hypothetical protein